MKGQLAVLKMIVVVGALLILGISCATNQTVVIDLDKDGTAQIDVGNSTGRVQFTTLEYQTVIPPIEMRTNFYSPQNNT
jgi:hypothetical protein